MLSTFSRNTGRFGEDQHDIDKLEALDAEH